jgi:protein gp37
MGVDTKIQWAHHTFNPWIGCSKVSPGCARCYAEELMDHRYGRVKWGVDGTRSITSESNWFQPVKWHRLARRDGVRRRVFCASLADVFEDRPELVAPRIRLFHLINETPSLDWLLLTKRPENVRRFHGGDGVSRSWAESMPPNVWLGTSIENADYLHRIDTLKTTGATILFLSLEPLLGPLPTLGEHLDGIDWCIIGGESGHHARPCDLAWIRSIRDQCRSAGVATFIKQLGARPTRDRMTGWGERPEAAPRIIEDDRLFLDDPKGGDPEEWPADLQGIREFPRIAAPEAVQ